VITQQLGLQIETLANNHLLANIENIDSTVCAWQLEYRAHYDASLPALSLQVLKTKVGSCGASVAMAQWSSSPASAFFLFRYASRRSSLASKFEIPCVPGYENSIHLPASVQFGPTGLGNPYKLLDGCFSWTR